jgi:hypothetical protein
MPMDRDFGLFVATAEGDVVQLPSANDVATASVQVIHNAADPDAGLVDIYVNGAKPISLDDFAFQEATEYLEVPANESLTITVAGPGSMDVTDGVVANFEVGPLDANGEYVVVANGVLGQGFNSPDENRSISFDLYPLAGNSASSADDKVAINAWHGSSDAPAVDIYADINGEPLVPNLDYGNASGWTEVDNQDITLTLTVAGDKSAVAGEFIAPLSAFGGESLFVFASGFLSPEDEPNMPINRNFGLFVTTAAGDVVALPAATPIASVQVIHNAADPLAETVDIYVNGAKPPQLDDFSFRDATEYLEVPANESLTITVAGAGSMDVTDQEVNSFVVGPLDTGGEYVVVANGVLGQGFNSPDQNRNIAFDLYPLAGRSSASSDDKVAINAWHGATDAPAVDIYVDINGEPLIPNLDYGNASGWTEVDNQDLALTLTVAGDNTAEVETYDAPLSAFGGQSLFIFASGFLSAEDEPNMPMERDFGLFVATEAGDVVQLSISSNIEINNELTALYPNPSQGEFTINSEKLFDKVRIVDMAGNEIYNEIMPSAANNFDVPELNVGNGNYLVILYKAEEIISAKMQVINK